LIKYQSKKFIYFWSRLVITEKYSGKSQKYLIIGGAPKSGTTSLFRYLADHPQICPAKRKETYFFAREFDYKGICQEEESRKGFEDNFSHCDKPSQWRLEGTPYTLYSKNASMKINAILPEAVTLFILRDPITRLFSDYKFHMLRKHPFVHGPFEAYVKFHIKKSRHHPNPLDLGCYIKYLKNFQTFFNQKRVHVVFFENFIKNPAAELQKVASLLNITSGFYNDYNFNPQNPTINVRNTKIHRLKIWFEPVVSRIRAHTLTSPDINRNFEKILIMTKKMYFRLNQNKFGVKEELTPAVKNLLSDFYRPFNQALSEELGQPLPWK
jgi:hypothetical protein